MIDIEKLRQLAQAATPGPDGVSLSWIKLLQDFQQGASPAVITELLDRIEAAEKSDAESIAMYRKARDERDELLARNEEMEKQEPVAWITRGGYPVPLDELEWQLWYGSEKPTLSWVNQEARPLYALPGAKGE